jgi:hypothetical protein
MHHEIHIEQGNEYWGETYIWCECLAEGETVFASSYHRPKGSDALFQPDDYSDQNVQQLLIWIAQHT